MRKRLEEILKSLGFTKLEIKAFIKLLELREATASSIGKELKLHRRSVYDVMERLVKKGVVGFIEREGKRYYKPIPEKIGDLIKEKKDKLENAEREYSKLIEKFYFPKGNINATILHGKEGIKRKYLEELEEGKNIYVICTDIEKTETLLGKYFLNKYTKERVKKKILIFMLTSREGKDLLKKYKLMKIKILPFNFITPASFSCYGDKLSIVLWGEEPVVFSIENKEVANSFKKYFKLLWKICKV